MTLTKQAPILTFSKVDYCPVCNRKLCKRVPVGESYVIEVKHKGLIIRTGDATISCVGCRHAFTVVAESGIIDEVS